MREFTGQPDDPIQRLLRLGKRLGYLTYEMLNEGLPVGMTASELDVLLMRIDSERIRLIDKADVPEDL